MINKKLMFIAIFFVSLLAVSAVNAADNNTNDIVSSDKTIYDINLKENPNYNLIEEGHDILTFSLNDGSFKDLSDEINSANGELNLTRDYVFDSGIDSANAIIINKPLVINGNGHNILAESRTSFFSITASNVILKNINFYDFSKGSILWQASNGTIINCKFEDCKNTDSGGAIQWNGINGSISDCIFKECSSKSYGGALYLKYGDLKINNCEFSDNAASTSSGGAIYLNNNVELHINNCTFNHNTAQSGGAIYGSSVIGSINNSKFNENSNLAIYWYGNNFEINNSIFTNNSNKVSVYFGIYNPINGEAGTVSTYGGAVYISGSYARISNSVFKGNKVSISLRSDLDRYKDTTFNQWFYWKIRETYRISSYGGAIALNGNKFYLDNISCENNLAYSAGRVDILYKSIPYSMADLNMEQYIYTKSYGGAIYLNGGGILNNLFISENKLDGHAEVNRGIVSTDICRTICDVKGYGVGIYWTGYSRNNLINNSKFIQNNLSSDQTGSALYLNNFNGDLNYNIFLENPYKIIDSSASEFSADYNWWGNTVSNFNKKLFSDDLDISKWLFLNMSSDNSDLEIGDKTIVTLDLTNVYDSSSNNVAHTYELSNVEFNLLANKIKTNISNAIINNGVANVEIVAQNYGQGSLSASYNGIKSTLTFNISKKASYVKSQINNCTIYNDELMAYLNITPNATGTLKIYLNNDFYSSIDLIKGNNAYSINLTGLNAGYHTLYALYNGDNNYLGSSDTFEFEIKKAYNNIQISNPYTVNYGDVITLNVDKGYVTDGNLIIQIKNSKNILIYNYTYNILKTNKITLPVLDAGDYNLFINYESSNYYDSHFDSYFTVNKLNPVINKYIISTVYGKSEMLFDSLVDGILKINIQNNTYKTFNIKSNKDYSLNFSDMDAGDYEIEFVFVPNNQNYYNSTSKSTLTIFKSEPEFDIVIRDINYEESAILSINYLKDITGFANITISNDEGFEIKFSKVALGNGVFTRLLSNLNASKYTMAFEYSGNNNYYPITISKTFNVFKIDPLMMVDVTNAVYGQTAKITVNSNAEGNITITIGSVKKYNGLLINDNFVSKNINDIDAGIYDVKVTFNGNNNYNLKTLNTKLTIIKASTNVVATVDDITYSQIAVINVKASVDGDVAVKMDNDYKNVNVMANTVTPITFDNVPSGLHDVSVALTPFNKNYDESSFKTNFTVYKKPTSVILDVKDFFYGEDVIINVTASENGKLVLNVGNITRERIVLANTIVKFNLGILTADSYNVEATFDAGESFDGVISNTKVTINPKKTTVKLDVDSDVYGNDVIVNVTASENGKVSVQLGSIVKSVDVEANKVTSVNFGVLSANFYEVIATFDGGKNYQTSSDRNYLEITPKMSTITIADTVNKYMYPESIVIDVKTDIDGLLTMKIADKTQTKQVEAEKIYSFNFGILEVGNYNVSISLDAGNNYISSSTNLNIIVKQPNTKLIVSDVTTVFDSGENLIATLKDVNDNVIPNAQITISRDYSFETFTTDDNGQISLSLDNFMPSNFILTFTYNGNDIYDKVSTSVKVTIEKLDIILTASYDSINKNIVATLKNKDGRAITAMDVYFIYDNHRVHSLSDFYGRAEFSTNDLVRGYYNISVISYGGTFYKTSNMVNVIVDLTKISTTLSSGDIVTDYNGGEKLVATLKDADGKVIGSAKVKIMLGNVTKTLTTNRNGQVSLSTDGLVPDTYTASITFSGNDLYTASSTTAKVTINKLDTKLTVKYDANNKNIVVTVKDVNGKPVSGLKVGFAIDGVKYAITNANGQVKYSTADWADGTYKVTVQAYGNEIYIDSNKETVKFTTENKGKSKIFLRNALYFVTQTKLVQVTLWDANNHPLANKTVSIRAYSSVWRGVTDENGDAFVRVGIGFGVHDATVSFDGDDQYNASTRAGYIRVIKQTPSVMVRGADTMFKASDTNKVVKVHLRDRYNQPLIANSKIVFKLNGKTYIGFTDINGVASIKININTAGTFNAQALYGGNTAFNAVTRDIKIRIT